MEALGFPHSESRNELFRLVSATLALGNIGFEMAADAGTQEVYAPQPAPLRVAAALLRVSEAPLARALVKRTIVVQGDKLDSPLSADGCADARDALAKGDTRSPASIAFAAMCLMWAVDSIVTMPVGKPTED